MEDKIFNIIKRAFVVYPLSLMEEKIGDEEYWKKLIEYEEGKSKEKPDSKISITIPKENILKNNDRNHYELLTEKEFTMIKADNPTKIMYFNAKADVISKNVLDEGYFSNDYLNGSNFAKNEFKLLMGIFSKNVSPRELLNSIDIKDIKEISLIHFKFKDILDEDRWNKLYDAYLNSGMFPSLSSVSIRNKFITVVTSVYWEKTFEFMTTYWEKTSENMTRLGKDLSYEKINEFIKNEWEDIEIDFPIEKTVEKTVVDDSILKDEEFIKENADINIKQVVDKFFELERVRTMKNFLHFLKLTNFSEARYAIKKEKDSREHIRMKFSVYDTDDKSVMEENNNYLKNNISTVDNLEFIKIWGKCPIAFFVPNEWWTKLINFLNNLDYDTVWELTPSGFGAEKVIYFLGNEGFLKEDEVFSNYDDVLSVLDNKLKTLKGEINNG